MWGLRKFWTNLRSSLWFVPSLIVLGAIGLAVGLLELGPGVDNDVIERWPRLFGAGEEGSRELLGAIVMAMITVTGVVFSVTVLILSQAASQYTPRILRNFMGSRAVQVVLGVFAGIFTYCLIVLRTIRGGDDPTLHPVAVFGGMVLALVGIGFLIFFIHHTAASLQAAEIIAEASRETRAAIDRLFPEELGRGVDDDAPREVQQRPWTPVAATSSGYVQRVETAQMLAFARRHEVVVRMECEVGDFVVEGLPIASLAGRDRVDDDTLREVNGLFIVHRFRTIGQDAAFGIRQIVDIALKGLSPSINDETTTVMCIDHLASLLARLAHRRIEPHVRGDDPETVRVIARGPTFESLVNTSLDQIRRQARGRVTVLERLLWCIDRVAAVTTTPRRREVLAAHLQLIASEVERVDPGRDRAILADMAARAARRLGIDAPELEHRRAAAHDSPG